MNYRKVWQKANGPIPKDEEGRSFEIHHIDGNRLNNNLTNLIAVSIQEHYNIHRKQQDWCAAFRISQRLKLSKSELGLLKQKVGESTRKRTLGTKFSQQHKDNLSKAHKGKPGTMAGKSHSIETKAKISRSHIGITHTNESKEKIRQARLGKPRSQASIEKFKQVRLGHKHSEETKRRMSEVRKRKSQLVMK